MNELENKKMIVMSLEQELTSLYEDKQHSFVSLDYIEVLTDVGQIQDRWLTIQKNTKKELLVFVKQPFSLPIEENIEPEAEALKNEIIIKAIYEYKGLNSYEEKSGLIRTIETFEKLGEEARIFYDLPLKLCISDETITMIALDDKVSLKPSITTMVIDHQNFAKSQKKVFESYWTSAITIEEFKRITHFKDLIPT